jgi:hypothetical protein
LGVFPRELDAMEDTGRLPAVVIDLDALEYNEGVLLSQLGAAPLTLARASSIRFADW